MAAIAATPFLCCNSSKFLLHPFYLLRYNINNNPFFSRKICKSPPTVLTSMPIRCVQSPQESFETRNQDMGFVQRANVVNILQERGLLESLTSENLRSVCSSSDTNQTKLKVYCGFDPTAESLHLGNLLGVIVLSWFQRCGHDVVALIGGATARVGDPSGKSIERPELDVETLDKNTRGISHTLSAILGRKWEQNTNSKVGSEENSTSNICSEQKSFSILNNFDWWKDVKLLDFLRQVGRFARVGTMMAKESVKRRVESEQGMSYTEFTYQLLQGYDFLYLFENKGVNVQIGGSDQWGNITAGTELIRKILQVEGAYGLTFPLLLKSDGTKFGKSEDGAIWLSSSMLSPYKFYQYFFSVPDVDVVRFLKILTFLDMEEINALEEEMKMPGYVPNSVQKKLAEEVTHFVHGEEGLSEALKATEALRPGTETKLDWKTIEGIAEDVPSCSMAYDKILNASVVDLSVSTGLLDSKSAARRLLKQGGLYLNNERVAREARTIEAADIVDGKVLLLSAGKKNKMVVLSFRPTCTIEEVASSCNFIRFFQLYVYKRREISAQLVKRAERYGYKAIVLTMDAPRLGRREADIRNRMVAQRLKNFEGLLPTERVSERVLTLKLLPQELSTLI